MLVLLVTVWWCRQTKFLHFEKNILCFRNLSKILIVHSYPRLAQTTMFTHFFNNRFRFFPFKAIDYWYHGWQTGCGDTIVHNMIISMSPPTAPRSTQQKQINTRVYTTRNNYLLGLLPLVSYCSKVIFSPWNTLFAAFSCSTPPTWFKCAKSTKASKVTSKMSW